MKRYNLDIDDAYKMVSKKRNIILPNKGFIRELDKYEEKLKKS